MLRRKTKTIAELDKCVWFYAANLTHNIIETYSTDYMPVVSEQTMATEIQASSFFYAVELADIITV